MPEEKVSTEDQHEGLRRLWIDRFVRVNADRPELVRFAGLIGRVVTVNWNNRAVVDFADGGWYDVLPDSLVIVDPAEAKGKYDPAANSSQAYPERQA